VPVFDSSIIASPVPVFGSSIIGASTVPVFVDGAGVRYFQSVGDRSRRVPVTFLRVATGTSVPVFDYSFNEFQSGERSKTRVRCRCWIIHAVSRHQRHGQGTHLNE
jgi:hypothetical protein